MKKNLDRTLVLENIIDKMFEIAGHKVTYKDIENRKDEWYLDYTMTKEQEKQWVEWGEKRIYESYKHFNKDFAKREMAMINLMYGLKLNENEQTGSTN